MSTIDIPQLLEEVSPDNPCGEDLAYDQAFLQLDQAATSKPEKRMGDSVIPGQEPNWSDVKDRALGLLARTKDLRVAVTLSRTLLHTDGVAGLRDGLELVAALLERYWEGMHPRLDPSDGKDPTFRINTLSSLSDWNGMVRSVREFPLVSSRLGRYSLRDIEIANGTTARTAGDEKPVPEPAVIEQAFLDADLDELHQTAHALRGALEAAGMIASQVSERTGVPTTSLERLTSCLEAATQILDQKLARRGAADGSTGDGDGLAADPPVSRRGPVSGEVQNREDVIRLLDKACEYYKRNEPSSPVPLLLERAKRLVFMDFLGIVRELAPGGLAEVRNAGGLTPES